MTATLAGFGQPGRREDLSGELLRAAHVHERVALARHGLLYLGQKGAKRIIRDLCRVCCRVEHRLVGAQLTTFSDPFLAAAVHQAHIAMTIDFQLPEGPGRKPVVVVAVKHDRRVVINPGLSEQCLELRLGDDVADEGVAQLGGPVPARRTGHMPLIVSGGIDVNFNDADICVVGMPGNPVG